jgi:GAF domain-containing protein
VPPGPRHQVSDLQPSSRANELVMRLGYRARLVVPLLAPDQIVGALVVRRKAPGEFSQSTVELLQIFARIALAAITLALAAVSAVDSASAGDLAYEYYDAVVESSLYGSP